MRPLLLATLSAALLLVGCTYHAPAPVHRHAGPRVVVIAKGHHHTHRCGHYFHGGRWYHLRGHVHGRGCGHVHVGGIWRVR